MGSLHRVGGSEGAPIGAELSQEPGSGVEPVLRALSPTSPPPTTVSSHLLAPGINGPHSQGSAEAEGDAGKQGPHSSIPFRPQAQGRASPTC